MNNLQVFNNPDFGDARVIEKDNETWFVGKDVAKALGYSNTKDALGKHVDGEDKRILQRSEIATIENHTPKSTPPVNFVGRDIPNRGLTVINESGLYSMVLSSKLPTAKKFKRWVTNEILPTIRKHGAYMTPEKLEEVLLNPDTLIQLAQNLKHEQEARKKAEEELGYKNDIIQGLVDDISLADKRRRVCQIVRKGTSDPHILGFRWNTLYKEFEMKYHMNLDKRMKSETKIKTKIDYIEKKLNMIPELYNVCCKLFAGDFNKLLQELKCTTV